MTKFVCKHPWTHFEVNNPNGDVTMCCNNNTVLGNVNEGSIEEIWNGEGFRDMRRRMQEEGAHTLCPHTCPVLKGAKHYENLDWYRTELTPDSPVYQNAALGDEDFKAGRVELEAKPRRVRFAYSYACNLDCYHCYQREDAKVQIKLPDSFMAQLPEIAKTSQVLLPFGGEPFLFKPVLKLVEEMNPDQDCRLEFVTNATLLTPTVLGLLESRKIGNIGVSLDAATEESYEVLRVRGRKAVKWAQVLDNLRALAELKTRKGFNFTISMTLNSVNYREIESFVDMGLELGAEPLLLLVSNPYQTVDFQKEFLFFTPEQFDDMFGQIQRAMPKLEQKFRGDAVEYLRILRAELRQHQNGDNNLGRFRAKRMARRLYHSLPEMLQQPIRRAVQKVRVRKFDSYSSE